MFNQFIAFLVLMITITIIHKTCNAEDLQVYQVCGTINISYPFQLTTDPNYFRQSYPRPRYELSCETNNLTVLYLLPDSMSYLWPYSMSSYPYDEEYRDKYMYKYYVKAINYNNCTIRLVDPNVHKDNCTAIPIYPLAKQDFNAFPFETQIRFKPAFSNLEGYSPRNVEFRQLTETVIFLSCGKPVRSSTLHNYINRTSCLNNNSAALSQSESQYNYSYVIVDHKLTFLDLESSCRIDQMAFISSTRKGYSKNDNKKFTSYSDIHDELLNGFELSWLSTFSDCYVDEEDSNKIHCPRPNEFNSSPDDVFCDSDYPTRASCGLLTVIRFYLEYYISKLRVLIEVLAAPRIICIMIVMGLLIYKWRRRPSSMYDGIEEFLQSHNNLMPLRYSYWDIRKMTKGFKTKLGEGGFGSVYKGKLSSGRLVAIKMLGKSKANGQDFINEVATIGRIHHVNVVQLIGFCVDGSKRALIYNFMPNGSLEKYIFSEEGLNSLGYKKLFEISLGIACGIEYLHQGCDMQILHFDIKPHNILLDENFIPKISDFGLARLCPLDNSIVSLIGVRGTRGYIAPEFFYQNIGKVSYKADVYSFGMLLMEMASNRKTVNPETEHTSRIYFPSWIYDQLSEGNEVETGDVSTEEESKLVKKMIVVALWCIQMKPFDRPSMNKVIEMLEAEIESLEMPPKPFVNPQENPVQDAGEKQDQMINSTEISSIESA